MVYDSLDGYVLLFGGYNESTGFFLNDTWEFSHGTWTELFPARAPTPRWLFGFTYDPMVGGAVLYGGGDFSPLGETWVFAKGQWNRVSPAGPNPPWRSDTALAYDAADEESVLFGGNGNVSVRSDTWILTGNSTQIRWTNATNSVHPPAQGDFGLAYDTELGRLILAASSSPATWTFDSGNWVNVTSEAPATYSFRSHFSLVDDPKDGYMLLTEGSTTAALFSDTWVLDGFDAPVTPRPSPGEVGVDVVFTTGVTGGFGPFTDSWTLGSAGLSNLSAPAVSYPSPGVVNVSVVVTDHRGVAADSSLSYTVSPKLAASIQSSLNTTDVGRPLTLNASSSGGVGPVTFEWHLPGNVNESGATVAPAFSAAGNFAVTLTATDSLGVESNATFSSSVAPDPTPLLSQSASNLAPGATLSVRASVVGGLAPYRYSWSFGDGTSGSGASATHSYPTVGSYRITLTVNDSTGFAANTSTLVVVSNATSGGISLFEVEVIAIVGAGVALAGAAVWITQRRRGKPPVPPKPSS